MSESTFIPPSVGRVVWYRPDISNGIDQQYAFSGQPLTAQICFVHSDSVVNLDITDANGKHYAKTSVELFQGEADDCPAGQCCWMPYQKGQAAKTEQLESELKVGGTSSEEDEGTQAETAAG